MTIRKFMAMMIALTLTTITVGTTIGCGGGGSDCEVFCFD